MALDQPHDKFFKTAFSNKEVLTDFAQAFLPPDLLRDMDWSTLERYNETYLSADLTEYYVDLLFTVSFGEERVQLALLFEHKSYVEKYPHFQINQYLLNFWSRQEKDGAPLTPIVPIVIYHGETKWKKKPVTAYFKHNRIELFQYVPSFDYVLINLEDVTTSNGLTLLRSDYARLTALLLNHSRNQRRLLRVFEEFADLFKRLSQSATGRTFIEASFLYIYWTTDLNKWQVVAIFQNISRQTGETAMTTAERLINEGIEKGIEQGIDIASVRYVRGLLKLGMSAETIAAALELPLAEVQAIITRIQSEEQ